MSLKMEALNLFKLMKLHVLNIRIGEDTFVFKVLLFVYSEFTTAEFKELIVVYDAKFFSCNCLVEPLFRHREPYKLRCYIYSVKKK